MVNDLCPGSRNDPGGTYFNQLKKLDFNSEINSSIKEVCGGRKFSKRIMFDIPM